MAFDSAGTGHRRRPIATGVYPRSVRLGPGAGRNHRNRNPNQQDPQGTEDWRSYKESPQATKIAHSRTGQPNSEKQTESAPNSAANDHGQDKSDHRHLTRGLNTFAVAGEKNTRGHDCGNGRDHPKTRERHDELSQHRDHQVLIPFGDKKTNTSRQDQSGRFYHQPYLVLPTELPVHLAVGHALRYYLCEYPVRFGCMVERVATVAFEGIEARAVDVQVQVAPGLPVFNIVGLPDKAVSEAKERVRAALVASGLALPARRITVNLAPADLPKEGSHYDLPIALGLMAAIGAIPHGALSSFTVLGELGLDGSIAAVAGVLPAAIGANGRGQGLICPGPCGPEAAWASPEIEVVAAQSLIQLANHFKGTQVLARPQPKIRERKDTILQISRDRKAPSARSKLPPLADTIC